MVYGHRETIINLKNHGQKEESLETRQTATAEERGPQGPKKEEVVQSTQFEKVSFPTYLRERESNKRTLEPKVD